MSATIVPCAFRAMNTKIELLLDAGEAAKDAASFAIEGFRAAEERFSRFLPDSELSQLNRVAGARCLVSDEMLEVLLLAEAFRATTDGAFNPLILPALEQYGYDETFDLVKRRPDFAMRLRELEPVDRAKPSIDPAMKSVKLPPRGRLDLGGIVKSWTVNRIARELRDRFGLARGCLNAGGDLVAWGGASAGGEPWLVGIENPWRPDEDVGLLALRDGAAATSGKLGRRWPTSEGTMHHLIDPASLRPSLSDVAQCTVAGPDVVECEIWAKTICILGLAEGLRLLERHTRQCEALLFASDRRIHYYGRERSLGRAWLGVPIDVVHYRPAIH